MSDVPIKEVSRATVRANMRIYDLKLQKWIYTCTCGGGGRRTVKYIVQHPSEYSFIEPGADK